jgi:hypothetical protein
MRILNVILFAAACAVIVLLAAQSDPGAASAAKDPNPMKGNQQQLIRMQQTEPMPSAAQSQ